MKNKRFCIHARFDLPPVENPWLDDLEEDLTAAPYAHWPERIFHACWGPNSAAPLSDADGLALELRDNYRELSFDFSPEILDWLQREQPRVYARILEADALSLRERGHGSALASLYPSLDLSSASPRDRRTALLWGIADFRARFKREPEGFWLEEGAAGTDNLELLAECGLRFAVAPAAAAAAVRPVGSRADSDWVPVDSDTVDATRPYRWASPSGAELAVFFYRPASAPAASNPRASEEEGRRFAVKLAGRFTANDAAQLVHVPVDGHVFGHLRADGHRALAGALDSLTRESPARRAVYAEFLDLFPAPQEAAVRPGAGSQPEGVLPWLAEQIDALFERRARPLLKDPWRARDAYGPAAFASDRGVAQSFLDRFCARHLSPGDAREALRLCESQRRRLQMLAPKAGQAALAYAARAIELLPKEDADPLEAAFLERLEPQACAAYRRLAGASRIALEHAAAHFCAAAYLDARPEAWAPISGKPPRAFSAQVRLVSTDPAVYDCSLVRQKTYEEGAYRVTLRFKPPLQLECWTSEDLSAPPRFTLDALFPSERRRALQGLLPHASSARRDFLERWLGALRDFRRDRADPSALIALLDRCPEAGLAPDELPGARELRDALRDSAADFAGSPSEPALARLSSLLEAVRRCGLHVNVWELQDLARPGLDRMPGRLVHLLGFSEAALLEVP